MGDRSRGLLRNEQGNPGKFSVRRNDGRDVPGEKHGRVAALAYADSCEQDGYQRLAKELRELVAKQPS